jgi:hypothetical protein
MLYVLPLSYQCLPFHRILVLIDMSWYWTRAFIGREAYPGGSIYCASKAAVRSFTESLRKELIATRIRIIEVDPGQVETVWNLVLESLFMCARCMCGAILLIDVVRNSLLFASTVTRPKPMPSMRKTHPFPRSLYCYCVTLILTLLSVAATPSHLTMLPRWLSLLPLGERMSSLLSLSSTPITR